MMIFYHVEQRPLTDAYSNVPSGDQKLRATPREINTMTLFGFFFVRTQTCHYIWLSGHAERQTGFAKIIAKDRGEMASADFFYDRPGRFLIVGSRPDGEPLRLACYTG